MKIFVYAGHGKGANGGYDSGAIAYELTKQNVNFTAYSIANVWSTCNLWRFA
jgi:hypothetical protein